MCRYTQYILIPFNGETHYTYDYDCSLEEIKAIVKRLFVDTVSLTLFIIVPVAPTQGVNVFLDSNGDEVTEEEFAVLRLLLT